MSTAVTEHEAVASFEPLFDLIEAAALLRAHPQTLKKMAISRSVPSIKAGHLWRFRAFNLKIDKRTVRRAAGDYE